MSESEIVDAVRKLYLTNVNEGYSKLLKSPYCYIRPAPGDYPFQFFWDTCMQVHVLVSLGEYDLAKRNMYSLFAMQGKDGFVGHMIFWKSALPTNLLNVLQARPTLQQLRPHMSAIIQPPLAAQAVLRIYEETHDQQFLADMLPKLDKYHNWLETNRDFEGLGLLSLITGFESGMDWKPSYDPVVGFPHGRANERLYRKVVWGVGARNFLHRYNLKVIYNKDYFIVKDAGFNSMYVLDLYAMAELHEGLDSTKACDYRLRASKATNAIMKYLYSPSEVAFYDVYSHQFIQSKILTPTIFFPTVLDEIPETVSVDVLAKHLLSGAEFSVPFPIPSVVIDDPAFYPYSSKFLWRGPTWVLYSWFLYRCLLYRGYTNIADTLLETVKKLVVESGFREYYNPMTGQGYGARHFTWSGLVVDMIHMRDHAESRCRQKAATPKTVRQPTSKIAK